MSSSDGSTSHSSRTFQYEVARAPTCPSERESARARCSAPIAVTAPVRISVIAVASITARGIPVSGSSRSSSASSDGSPSR